MSTHHPTAPLLRRLALAGVMAVSFTGTLAIMEGAQAMPLAAPSALQDVQASAGVTKAQYYGYGYGYRRPYRRYYGFRRGRAGLYGCGPYAYHTRLSRKACR
jgi:hypothetical protein